MQRTSYQILDKKEKKEWKSKKEKEWNKNANFWITIIRKKLDPFRLVVTNKAMLEALKSKRKLKILGAGCGEGYLCRMLAKRGHHLFGVDLTKKLISVAKELEEKKPLGIKYFVEDFRKTNFPSSFFDVIFSHHTINEIENPEKAFKEFFRILKKGGHLILLFLHPCFDIKNQGLGGKTISQLYFQKTKIKKEYYLVSGIKSPSPYFYLHLPLSQWIEYITKAGFLIQKIKEPRPPLKLLIKNKWWRKNFQRPRFIFIEAVKK